MKGGVPPRDLVIAELEAIHRRWSEETGAGWGGRLATLAFIEELERQIAEQQQRIQYLEAITPDKYLQ
jgi:galactokinase